MLDNIQNEIWDVLAELDGETVTRLFTCYYGMQLLTEDFKKHLIEEGYIYEEEEEEEEL